MHNVANFFCWGTSGFNIDGAFKGEVCVCVFVCLCAEIGMKYSDTTKQSVQNEAMFLCTYQKKYSAVIYQ